MKECPECNTPHSRTKYCSHDCMYIASKRRTAEQRREKHTIQHRWGQERICPGCGSVFTDDKRNSHGVAKTYCTERCRQISHHRRNYDPHPREWTYCGCGARLVMDRAICQKCESNKPRLCACGVELEPHRRWCPVCLKSRRQEQNRRNTANRKAMKQGNSEKLTRVDFRLADRCAYCLSTENLTIDHVVPLSRGGEHTIENLTTACWTCNCSKGAKLLEEWIPFLAFQIQSRQVSV